ncbi:MAG TPA: MoxR family ATPase, partial [Bryobacteraceae bacterium]
YIHSRLQPQILIDFPERMEELAILRENLPFAEDQILDYVTDFLQRSHAAEERFTVRDGINAARYAMKLESQTGLNRQASLDRAFADTLGDDAIRHAPPPPPRN